MILLMLLLVLIGCSSPDSVPPDPVTPAESGSDPDPFPFPDPITTDHPLGPEELQSFAFIGYPETVSYNLDVPTEFSVTIYVDEEGLEGNPSKLLGFSVTCQWDAIDYVDPVSVEWSSYIHSIAGGNGPDLVIGGFGGTNEIAMGCIANTDAAAIDYWYLPEEPQPLITATFSTVPTTLSGEQQINFTLGPSSGNADNAVVVGLPTPDLPYDHSVASALPAVNNWQVTLEEE